jgi:hypothetical protein
MVTKTDGGGRDPWVWRRAKTDGALCVNIGERPLVPARSKAAPRAREPDLRLCTTIPKDWPETGRSFGRSWVPSVSDWPSRREPGDLDTVPKGSVVQNLPVPYAARARTLVSG